MERDTMALNLAKFKKVSAFAVNSVAGLSYQDSRFVFWITTSHTFSYKEQNDSLEQTWKKLSEEGRLLSFSSVFYGTLF